MNNRFGKYSFFSFAKLLFYLFFAFLPFQINSLLAVEDVFMTGFFNPYTSFFIYISDVFLLLSLTFLSVSLLLGEGYVNRLRFLRKRSDLIFLLVIAVFFLLNIVSFLSSVFYVNTLFALLRLFEFVVVLFLLKSGFVDRKRLMYVFIGVVSFVAFIGIFQYLLQESLGLRFFGEPLVNAVKPGVAKVGLVGHSVMRIYGTFPHPNIFAGYLSFAILFAIYCFRDARVLFGLLLAVCLLALTLTFSRSAFFGLFLALFLYYVLSNIKITWRGVVLVAVIAVFFIVAFDLYSVIVDRVFFADKNAFVERSRYYLASKRMFLDNLSGVGLGNFTVVMQRYLPDKLQPWLIQPVHNIFLLELNEIGLFGGIAFLALFVYFFYILLGRQNRFSYILMSLTVFIVAVGLFDHYFVSLYQGNALLFLYFGLVGTVD